MITQLFIANQVHAWEPSYEIIVTTDWDEVRQATVAAMGKYKDRDSTGYIVTRYDIDEGGSVEVWETEFEWEHTSTAGNHRKMYTGIPTEWVKV